MKVDTYLVEKTSSKTGKPYTCLVIKLTDNYEKIVFLNPAELELCKTFYGSNSK